MKFNDLKILIVDDVIENIQVAIGALQSLDLNIFYATSGKQALERLEKNKVNLILMDIMMPELDGIQTVKLIKSNPKFQNIPVIFLTAKSEEEDIRKGFDVGGVDYVLKPFNPSELLLRVKTHLELSRYRDELEILVHERTRQILDLKYAIIETMGALAEYRDNETGTHIMRTKKYVEILAKELMESRNFNMSKEYVAHLCDAAPMHDIGKVAIRDNILLKPSSLTPEEFKTMQEHTIIGEKVIEGIMKKTGEMELLKHAKDIAAYHHEKWDGSGYPAGLKGEDIPLSARVMAIADVYDALISPRVYKEPFTHEKAVEIIKEVRGTHFDPQIVDIFLKKEKDFLDISNEMI